MTYYTAIKNNILTLSKLEIEGNFHNMIKHMYKRTYTNIRVHDNDLDDFPLR